MPQLKRFAIFALLLLAGQAATAAPDFDRDVAPILLSRCIDCHGGADPKGHLDLSRKARAMAGTDEGPVIVAGKADKSRLWEVIAENEMPPKKPLPPEERAILRAWVDAGATWGTDPIDPFSRSTDKRAGRDWWSLQPVVRPSVPAVKQGGWVRNGIDPFVLSTLEQKGLPPSPEADKRLLIRRLSFDLTGLPPSPAEVDAFVADPAPDAYEKLVDRLLASPQHGVRWARHWLDVVRFGQSNGFEHDEFRPDAWPYRNWVVDAINSDLPYDQFVKLQIAGDVLQPGDAAALSATGFLVAGAFDSVGQGQISQVMRKVVRQDELEDIVGTIGQTFVGLTVQCARCHDHKFDPVSQKEYYQLTAAVAGVRHGVRDLPLPREQVAEAKARLAAATAELASIETPARQKILAARGGRPAEPPPALARWDFRTGGKDQYGNLNIHLSPGARLSDEGLVLDGKAAFAAAGPIGKNLRAKTLEAWVKLSNLQQSGGGVIGIQTSGAVFDSVVYGERQAGRWMAGSNNFQRTQDNGGPADTDAAQRFVHVAITYADDGTITAYRDGKPYGRGYRASNVADYEAGEAEILFGMRHSPAGGNRMLAGVIQRAAIYDRALTEAEVEASSQAGSDFISVAQVEAELTPAQRDRRRGLVQQIEQDAKLSSGTGGKVYAVSPRPPEPTFLLVRGNPQQPAEPALPGGLAAVAGVKADFALAADTPDVDRRAALANWIADPANPLTKRVIVNRLWHYHFGVGIVDTPNDFGFSGGRPSHPQLLDYLADELVRQKFSLKAMHRLIVTSATYRQSSRTNPAALAIDADNRLLWRKSPIRMDAETVRDTVLALSGELGLQVGGPGFSDFVISKARGTITHEYAPMENAPGSNRRTLYRAIARGARSGLLDALDCPDPSATSPRRAVSNTPLQALALLNNATMLRSAQAMAARIERETTDVEARIKEVYRLSVGRVPGDDEVAAAKKVVEAHGLAVVTRAIMNSNEFLFVE
ncbi:DUF1553 domain-containing protein [Humisphaera borealis]|uniref:DUF1553 domain-containing protein n=1 Tax=Humisphaera borealis TaxID=2807512 RepID=A0A7M2X0N3_9BACT|nr:DUF1553 domain-containing protein [Humisphaera borealis]QOV91308.1 DUF1553 domain-containing protein [Humisphaera borealis]